MLPYQMVSTCTQYGICRQKQQRIESSDLYVFLSAINNVNMHCSSGANQILGVVGTITMIFEDLPHLCIQVKHALCILEECNKHFIVVMDSIKEH